MPDLPPAIRVRQRSRGPAKPLPPADIAENVADASAWRSHLGRPQIVAAGPDIERRRVASVKAAVVDTNLIAAGLDTIGARHRWWQITTNTSDPDDGYGPPCPTSESRWWGGAA